MIITHCVFASQVFIPYYYSDRVQCQAQKKSKQMWKLNSKINRTLGWEEIINLSFQIPDIFLPRHDKIKINKAITIKEFKPEQQNDSTESCNRKNRNVENCVQATPKCLSYSAILFCSFFFFLIFSAWYTWILCTEQLKTFHRWKISFEWMQWKTHRTKNKNKENDRLTVRTITHHISPIMPYKNKNEKWTTIIWLKIRSQINAVCLECILNIINHIKYEMYTLRAGCTMHNSHLYILHTVFLRHSHDIFFFSFS